MSLKEKVGKSRAKKSSLKNTLARLQGLYTNKSFKKDNGRTIYNLKPTTRGSVDIMTIRAVQFDGVKPREIRSATWNHMTSDTVNPGTSAKLPTIVLLHLDKKGSATATKKEKQSSCHCL